MNKQETAKIIAVLQINYPDSFKNFNDTQLEGLVSLWTSVLADNTYQEVSNAVMAHIATDTGRFMPPVGVIKNMIVKLTTPQEMTELEAWGLVSKAVCNSNYNSEQEFEKLPKPVQIAVGSPSMLKAWAMINTDEFNTVIQSNFMRSYKAAVSRSKHEQALPSKVKEFIGLTGMTENKLLN